MTRRAVGAVALGLIVLLVLVLYVRPRMRLSEEELETRIVSTIQSEAPQSFLVTGSVDIVATVNVTNVKTLLPGILDFDVGSTRAMVQVPGRAYYGFDVRALDQSRIDIRGDTVVMRIPDLSVLSVDSNLEELRVWSGKDWLRSNASRADVERSAIKRLDAALRRQAEQHVARSAQPRVNTAEAIERSVTPVLREAGLKPIFRFELSERLQME